MATKQHMVLGVQDMIGDCEVYSLDDLKDKTFLMDEHEDGQHGGGCPPWCPLSEHEEMFYEDEDFEWLHLDRPGSYDDFEDGTDY